ncbi:MAG: O-methyltransferase [Pseudomonadota bacterium]
MSDIDDWDAVDPLWSAVDQLIELRLLNTDAALTGVIERCKSAGLPDIAVSPSQGKFLQMLAEVKGARRVLEIGTLGGYSTIHLARAVGAKGLVVSLESNVDYARIAEENIAAAGCKRQVDVRVGEALESLELLTGPFDMTFIDADKVNNIAYVEHAVRLSEKGALIVVDNAVRAGDVLDPQDESAIGTRALYEHLENHRRLEGTALQTVGDKGWDGMMILRVL